MNNLHLVAVGRMLLVCASIALDQLETFTKRTQQCTYETYSGRCANTNVVFWNRAGAAYCRSHAMRMLSDVRR